MSSDMVVLARELQPFIKRSVATGPGNVPGTTLVDATLVEANDYWNGMALLVLTGTFAGQLRRVTDFDQASNTLTLDHSVGGQVTAGIRYAMVYPALLPMIIAGPLPLPTQPYGSKNQLLQQGDDPDYPLITEAFPDPSGSLIGASQLHLDNLPVRGFPDLNKFFTGMYGQGPFATWTSPIDLKLYWDELGLRKPAAGLTWINAYSRAVYDTPFLSFRAGFNDIQAIDPLWGQYYAGFEKGDGIHAGIISFTQEADNSLRAIMWQGESGQELNVTNLLPADYLTAQHWYSLKVNVNNSEFSIGATCHRLLAVIVPIGGVGIPGFFPYALAGPPYAIGVLAAPCPTRITTLIEAIASVGSPCTFQASPRWFRAASDQPRPSRLYQLYQTGTNNPMRGTIFNAPVTSHPFPLFGYKSATLKFVSPGVGSLQLETLCQSGNFRASGAPIPIAANDLKTVNIDTHEVLGRVVWTADAWPNTPGDAEVLLI